MYYIFFMCFYFFGQFIYTDGDDKQVELDMYTVVPFFEVLMPVMAMNTGKTILKISSVILL